MGKPHLGLELMPLAVENQMGDLGETGRCGRMQFNICSAVGVSLEAVLKLPALLQTREDRWEF